MTTVGWNPALSGNGDYDTNKVAQRSVDTDTRTFSGNAAPAGDTVSFSSGLKLGTVQANQLGAILAQYSTKAKLDPAASDRVRGNQVTFDNSNPIGSENYKNATAAGLLLT